MDHTYQPCNYVKGLRFDADMMYYARLLKNNLQNQVYTLAFALGVFDVRSDDNDSALTGFCQRTSSSLHAIDVYHQNHP